MKVKEVDRTANIAWSPATQVPIYLAAGTAAQQLDATFSTTSTLELYSLNLSETGHDMPIAASLPVEQRFHKVIWGQNGMDNGSMPSGLIVGGSDRGVINMYDAHKLIKGENSLVSTEEKHTGPVAALDFNPFQSNLLASGASESEIFIWDVNKKSAPMNPGPKSQPLDDVRCISWNRQVQHILASAFASRCLVWDLRKNDPIIKVSDSTSRMRYKIVAWHPDVATQLCLASEDDHTPFIQIWDLRAASSPLKTLEGHTKGILSLAWCKDDSDLLLSCGKDNRILVWNPNSPQGEIVAELPTSNQWSFDVTWCPRNPAVIASSSFDGRVSVYSLMGGQQQVQPTNKITESFGPGMEGLQQPQTAAPQIPMQLKSPPKWLRKPCGASFGFGGKLVSFENPSQSFTNAQGVQQTKNLPQVYVSQVVTEENLVGRSLKLETSLQSGNHPEFIQAKLDNLENEDEIKVWKFIGASFSQDPATEYLSLLGIDLNEINDQLQNLVKSAANINGDSELKPEVNGVAADISCMKIADQTTDDFEVIAAVASELEVKPTALDIGFDIEDSVETSSGQLNLALLTGNLELAVKLCIEQRRWADALILSAQAGQAVLTSTRALYFQQENNGGGNGALVEAVAHDSWEKLVTNADLESWKQVLCALVVYCQQDRRLKLAGVLASRLSEAGVKYRTASTLCYIVSMDMEKVLELWIKETCTPDQLQDMVEVVVMLRAAIQAQGLNANLGADSKLASRLASYAVLLASQGCLQSALVYLGDTGANPQLQELKERLEKAVAGPVKAVRQQPVQQPAAYGSTANRNSSGPGSRPDSRRSSYQPVERKSSYGLPTNQPGQFNTGIPSAQQSFNTGLPGAGGAGYGAPAMQPAVSSYGQPQPSYGQPPVISSYGQPQQPVSSSYGQPQPPVSSSYGQPQPPVSSYGGSTGYMEPSQPSTGFQPPPPAADLPAFTPAGANPLLRRSRAVDPSIAAGAPGYQNFGGQGGYQQQSYGGMSSYGDQAGQPLGGPASNHGLAAQPAIFTPEPISSMATPARSRNTSESVSAGGALPPNQGFKYTPDHGGPGWKPQISSGHGWNDPPPAIMSKPKLPENPPTPSYMSQGPIFTPLMNPGMESSNAAAPPPSGGFQPQQSAAAADYQQPAIASNGWAGFQPAPQPSYGQGMMGGLPGGQMGGPGSGAPQPAAPAPAPEPVPLAPIPVQHIEIQEVLDALLNRCKQASTHPQTKRKLDDVHSKLEILYNKLRKEILSEVTLQGLHQIVMLVRQYDYMSCVQVISGLIAGGSFAELADFMPGIKVLIQVAQQSGVYLEQQ